MSERNITRECVRVWGVGGGGGGVYVCVAVCVCLFPSESLWCPFLFLHLSLPLSYFPQDISDNAVFLYLKGTPQQPMCGFSKRVVQILDSHGNLPMFSLHL